MTEKIINRNSIVIALIILAILSRLLPHEYNFASITATALFGGAYLKDKRWALIIPLIAMFVSDTLLEYFYGIGFYEGMFVTYFAFASVGFLGIVFLQERSFTKIISVSLLASGVFFLITNFAFFYPEKLYTHNISGIVKSYTLAIPFFWNTLKGDLFYTALLFGGFALLEKYTPTAVAVKNS